MFKIEQGGHLTLTKKAAEGTLPYLGHNVIEMMWMTDLTRNQL